MKSYDQLVLYLIEIEKEGIRYKMFHRIALVMLVIFVFLFCFVLIIDGFFLNTNLGWLEFIKDVEILMGLSGVSASSLATAIQSEIQMDSLRSRRMNLFLSLENSISGGISDEVHKDILVDLFKDSLKQ